MKKGNKHTNWRHPNLIGVPLALQERILRYQKLKKESVILRRMYTDKASATAEEQREIYKEMMLLGYSYGTTRRLVSIGAELFCPVDGGNK